jgi:hypothetical protein
MQSKHLMGLVPALVVAFALPASAYTAITEWTGTITSGSVTSSDGSTGFAVGGYTGQSFELVVTYQNQPAAWSQATYTGGNLTGLSGAFFNTPMQVTLVVGGAEFTYLSALTPDSVAGTTSVSETADSFSENISLSYLTDRLPDGYQYGAFRSLSMTADNFSTPLDLEQSIAPVDINDTGSASYCDQIHENGTISEPLCFSFTLDATSFMLANPFAPPLPEPATWAMMLLGFGGVGWMLRINRKRAASVMG